MFPAEKDTLFHVKLYTLLKTQDHEKSGTYPLRLNKGVPSEYLHFLVFCLIQNRQKSHELFHHLCFCSIHILFGGSQQFPDRFGFSLWREISLVLRPIRAIRVSEGGLEPSANSPDKLVRWHLIRNGRERLRTRRRKSLIGPMQGAIPT